MLTCFVRTAVHTDITNTEYQAIEILDYCIIVSFEPTISILYMFFWVFPRRQFVFCRRFGALCQVHLQRLDVEYEVFIFIFHIQPLKMDLTEGSETSEKQNLTPGKYPKEHIQY
jgi:hypothetical protein